MATVYLKPGIVKTDPHIHLMCIGVGDYPQIQAHQNEPNCPQFANLAAPPASAIRLAKYFMSNSANFSIPVGSIELVTSPVQSVDFGAVPINTTDATLDGIQDAFSRWESRCDWCENSIGIFYFCGHGVSAGIDTLLLASDFFRHPNNPFERSIRIEDSVCGMSKIRAKSQIYLVDCCRAKPPNYNPNFMSATPGQTLKPVVIPDPNCSVIVYAAKPDQEAFGSTAAQATPFVELVIEGIELGKCAMRSPQDWRVSLVSLSEKCTKLSLLRQRQGSTGLPTQTTSQRTFYFDQSLDRPIKIMVAPPTVETSIHLLTLSPSSSAVLIARGATGVLAQLSQPAWKSSTEVLLSLPAGPVELFIIDPALPGIRTIPINWIEPAHIEISV